MEGRKIYKDIEHLDCWSIAFQGLQEAWYDDKKFEICTVDFEFESGHAILLKAWDNQGFTHSPESIKNTFFENGVFSNLKTKKVLPSKIKGGVKKIVKQKSFWFVFFLSHFF